MKTHKGRFTPTNPKKYTDDVNNIIFRSSWERRFMVYCDQHSKILNWSSESLGIPYISPVDNKIHTYYPDFLVEIESKEGSKKTVLIEVKPYSQCFPPKKPKRQTRRFITECATYAVNQAKWDAAKALCKKKGWEWKVLTEKELKPGK